MEIKIKKLRRVKEPRICCPVCQGSDLFFDSPTTNIDIILEGNKMLLRRQLDGKRMLRLPKLKDKLRREMENDIFLWTCRSCGEFIDSSFPIWKLLQKRSLKFLK